LVIIPTHDRRAMLTLTLRTVLWQEDADLKAIVDEGSTDGTGESLAARVGTVKHWAYAALWGEMGRVITDVWSMTRVRLARHLSVGGPPDPHARWWTQAQAWLGALEGQ
jgi:hypothetical protein